MIDTLIAHAATESEAAHAEDSSHVEEGAHGTEKEASPIHVVLKAEEIANIGGFPITNSLLMTWIVMAVIIAGAAMLRAKLSLVPGKIQAGIEWVFTGILNYMTEILESEKLARRFFPLIMTIFLFVFIANEMAFLPGVGTVGLDNGHGGLIPFLRAPSADLNMTLALAVISFLTIEITGLKMLGAGSYISKYLNFTSPVNFVVGIIEIVSNLGRLISFSFRLFGNIFAGEVMLVVVAFFVPYLLPVPLMGFEVFVGFIQAVVFAMLTLFFIKLAIMEPHGSESH